MEIEKIVDYSFERKENSNVLAIHPTRPLIAYLINIQRPQKISKAWSSGNDSIHQSPNQSSQQNSDKNKTVSIRIIDYVTRQRCLAKGVYHARPADCVFTINSLLCSSNDIFKMAVVDRLANIYLYDLSYFLNELTTTRIAVIRGPAQNVSPYEYISLVWCPFVPCEDFEDGDGGLRLALATNSRIEIFAIDRIQGRTGELQRNDLDGAYKCIQDPRSQNIVSLSISPDCSTLSAAAIDNRVTFFSCDIDDGEKCLHNWEASITDKSTISKLFFLDDYPKLLEDNTMKFWGTAFIGTRSGQILLVDLRTWSAYQRTNIQCNDSGPKNFDYRIDMTSKNIIAMNGNSCYVVQIEHNSNKPIGNIINQHDVNLMDTSNSDLMNGNVFNYFSKVATQERSSSSHQRSTSSSNKKNNSSSSGNNNGNDSDSTIGLPRIVKTTKLSLYNQIYSFVVKHKSEQELELFTISPYSLERCTINLNAIKQAEPEVDKKQKMSKQQQQEQELQNQRKQQLSQPQQQLQQQQQQLQPQSIITSEVSSFGGASRMTTSSHHEIERFLQQFEGSTKISSSGSTPQVYHHGSSASSGSQTQAGPILGNMIPTSVNAATANLINHSPVIVSGGGGVGLNSSSSIVEHNSDNRSGNISGKSPKGLETGSSRSSASVSGTTSGVVVDPGQMDRMVETLFKKLNVAFSKGLDEFLADIKCEVDDVKGEVNDLKAKVSGLSREVRKLQQLLQETRLQK